MRLKSGLGQSGEPRLDSGEEVTKTLSGKGVLRAAGGGGVRRPYTVARA